MAASSVAFGQSAGGSGGGSDLGLINLSPSATADTFRSSLTPSYAAPIPGDVTVTNPNRTASPAAGSAADQGGDETQTRSPGGIEPYRELPKPPGIAKAVKPLKQYGPKRALVRDPLPPLRPYLTAIRPRGQLLGPPSAAAPTLRGGIGTTPTPDLDPPLVPSPLTQPGPTVAAVPTLERPRKFPVDPAPYAPVGIGIGSVRITPYVETDLGYDSNPDQTLKSLQRPSVFAHVDGGASFQSEWSRHSLSGELHGGYYDYFSNQPANRPDASGTVNGRIDMTRDTHIDTATRFSVSSQRPGSPEVVLGAAATDIDTRPLTYTYGGDVGVTHNVNRFAATLKGSFDRIGFEDANFENGTVLPLSRNTYNQYGATARLSYELTPSVKPFGEAYGNVRRPDSPVDSGGVNRNSTGEGARFGSAIAFGGKLTGELSAGFEHRDYQARSLRPVTVPLVDASLVYSVTPLTTIALRNTSEVDETNIPGASGAVGRRVSLEAAHALLRNVTITGLLAYTNVDYKGINLNYDVYDMGLKVDYALSRSVVVRGSFTHERLLSATPGLDYTQNVFLLGLRLQR